MELVQFSEKNDIKPTSQDVISVVIPVYNVECYLQVCVESVRCQSHKQLEIILVDDGSTDNSGKICDEYARKDERIKTIHKHNGGLSEARNTGIDAATGNYIAFIDSDDYISPEMIHKLYTYSKTDNADITICGYQTITENGDTMAQCGMPREKLTRFQAQEKLNDDGQSGAPFVVAWNKLYRKQLFSDIRFPVGKIHEDAFIMHKVFDRCSTISTVDGLYYYYRQRTGSITKRNFSVQNLDCVEAYYQRYCYYRNLGGAYRRLLKKAGQRFAVEYYYEKVHFKPKTREERDKVHKTDKMARKICFDLFSQWSLGMKCKLLMPNSLYMISMIRNRNIDNLN